ncbi:hypothetical protein QR680_016719 [Steinernema hermaphroditum]|uniref:Uncharacterized protein n=1 Tax=Steinernema hermaphroditum TaxID=289476 RepID=A0AA39HD75_9BILA|nr:hypothetical protein QR680_016719 [Steinernema hermaphroditum]
MSSGRFASSTSQKRETMSKKSLSTRSDYFSDGNPSTFCRTELLPKTGTLRVQSALSCVDLIPVEDIRSGRTFEEAAKIISRQPSKDDVIHFDMKHIVHEVPIWGMNAKHERNNSFYDPNPWRRHGCVQKLHQMGGWVSQGDKSIRKADRQYVFVHPGTRPPLSPQAPLFNHYDAGTEAALNASRGMPPAAALEKKASEEFFSAREQRTEVGRQTPKHFFRTVEKSSGRKGSRRTTKKKKSRRSAAPRTVSVSRTQSSSGVSSRFVSPLRRNSRNAEMRSLKLVEPSVPVVQKMAQQKASAERTHFNRETDPSDPTSTVLVEPSADGSFDIKPNNGSTEGTMTSTNVRQRSTIEVSSGRRNH